MEFFQMALFQTEWVARRATEPRRLISVTRKGLSIWLLPLYEGLALPRYRYFALRA